MKIKMRYKHDIKNGAIIQEFARMEMRPAKTNDFGVYLDYVSVPCASANGWLFLVHVALGEDGYHVAVEYENHRAAEAPSLLNEARHTRQKERHLRRASENFWSANIYPNSENIYGGRFRRSAPPRMYN